MNQEPRTSAISPWLTSLASNVLMLLKVVNNLTTKRPHYKMNSDPRAQVRTTSSSLEVKFLGNSKEVGSLSLTPHQWEKNQRFEAGVVMWKASPQVNMLNSWARMKEIATVPTDDEEKEATAAILNLEGRAMQSGWYAAIIRLRIKRRPLSCQNWHKSDSRNSKLIFFCSLLHTPEMLHCQYTKHALSFLFHALFYNYMSRKSAEIIPVHLCTRYIH